MAPSFTMKCSVRLKSSFGINTLSYLSRGTVTNKKVLYNWYQIIEKRKCRFGDELPRYINDIHSVLFEVVIELIEIINLVKAFVIDIKFSF